MKHRVSSISLAALMAAAVCAQASADTLPLSEDARQTLDWVKADIRLTGQPFIVLDKKAAHVWVFDGKARLAGATPVLLGLAKGDDSVPGIGEKPIGMIQPHERTTPAGRFAMEPGKNAKGESIYWVDYDAAISLHRIRASKASERRVERLASPEASDNRISYGCINVPERFYSEVIDSLFSSGKGSIYILPETRSLSSILK
jgi:hypothetical protein